MGIHTGTGAEPESIRTRVGATRSPASGQPGSAGGLTAPSVLFPDAHAGTGLLPAELTALEDLQLNRVQALLSAGHEEFGLDVYFQIALVSPAAVSYRQAVLKELDDPGLRTAVQRFVDAIAGIRQLRRAGVSDHRPSRYEAHVLAAANTYCRAVRQIEADLSGCRSQGLGRLHRYLASYVSSVPFVQLEAQAADIHQEIRGIRYRLEIEGNRVSVSPPVPGGDYRAEVAAAFARLPAEPSQAAAEPAFSTDDLSEVEAQVLDAVGRLFPASFARRARFAASYRDFPDPTVMRFAREVCFYLAYLQLIAPLRSAGLPFCFPQVGGDPGTVAVLGAFDLALACKRAAEPPAADAVIVANDIELSAPERIIVVTGPNNGGKTTFARSLGQLYHLARLGLCVPARSAVLPLADRVLTHFEREEDIATLQGKFDEELVRARDLLRIATPRSVIVMNESFNSTSLVDARFVGAEILERITALGCLAVYVTFVDELADLGPATVSMVAQVMAEDPSQRTLRIVRQAPTGLAHTRALAERYGLSYDQLIERIEP